MTSLKKQIQSSNKALQENEQKCTQLNSNVLELENKFKSQNVDYGIVPTEQTNELQSQIYSLVRELPKKFTEIIAELSQTDKVVQFYIEMAGVKADEVGWERELGLLRYLIAYGDTTIQTYTARVNASSEDYELIERNKYSVYNRFSEAVLKL